jgi:hypothetical protein
MDLDEDQTSFPRNIGTGFVVNTFSLNVIDWVFVVDAFLFVGCG